MNVRRRYRSKYAMLAVATYFATYTVAQAVLASRATDEGFVDSIISSVQDTFAKGIDIITTVIIGGFAGIINAGFEGIQSGLSEVIDIFLAVPQMFGGFLGTLGDGVNNALENVLGLGAIHVPEVTLQATAPGTTGPFGIPGIGWAVIAMIIISLGLGMYQITEPLPGPGKLWTGFSVIIMTIGAMLGLWGMFPEIGMYIIVVGFAVIVLTAAWAVRGIISDETGP